MKRIPKYRRWLVREASLTNYIGLNESEKAWLRNFNKQEIDTDFRESDASPEVRSSCYRRNYRQRMDALNVAIRWQEGLRSIDPTDSLSAILDRARRARRVFLRNEFRTSPTKKESKDGRTDCPCCRYPRSAHAKRRAKA